MIGLESIELSDNRNIYINLKYSRIIKIDSYYRNPDNIIFIKEII